MSKPYITPRPVMTVQGARRDRLYPLIFIPSDKYCNSHAWQPYNIDISNNGLLGTVSEYIIQFNKCLTRQSR